MHQESARVRPRRHRLRLVPHSTSVVTSMVVPVLMGVLAGILVGILWGVPATVVAAPIVASVAVVDDPLEGLPDAVARQIRDHLPGVVERRSSDVPALKRADRWLPLEAVEYEFEPTGGGKPVRWTLKPAKKVPGEAAGTRGWTLVDSDGTTRYLALGDDGTIRSRITINHPNGVLIRLDPPEPVVRPSGTSAAGERIEISVSDLGSPTDVEFSGKVTCTWSDLGGFRVSVPAGEFDARLLRVHYRGSVGPASVDGSRLLFVAPGTGPVAFSVDRDISAFIFFHEDARHAGTLRRIVRDS